jgi:hypothetical protein
MSEFKSHSQAGQDIFAWIASGKKENGTYLDIGSGHAVVRNNTYALEQVGWDGDLVDVSDLAADSAAQLRHCRFHRWNAETIDWGQCLGDKTYIDYLSLDVDESSFKALHNLPNTLKFGAITIEHDAYRFGFAPRSGMRMHLTSLGYKLVAADVKADNLEFEDWWVAPMWEQNATAFISQSQDWNDVVRGVVP